jgi:glutathione S-transferase
VLSLTLYYHPLASYCHKVLIALYEAGTSFTPRLIELQKSEHRAELGAFWPLCKFPVIHDAARGLSLPEATIIIEYLDRQYPGPQRLIPADADEALSVRLWDRIFDNYVHTPMQEIVLDRIKQSNADLSPQHTLLDKSYALIDQQLATHAWAASETFSLADCAAAPALFYATTLLPIPAERVHLQRYFEQLMDRPSVRRTLDEARPWFHFYPFAEAIPARFR